MAIVTTFEAAKQLFLEAVNEPAFSTNNAIIKSGPTKAYLQLRIANLMRRDVISLDAAAVASVEGNVTLDTLEQAVEVATGAPVTPNRVTYAALAFAIPVRLLTSFGSKGFLVGAPGGSGATQIADADITLQYRFSAADPWKLLTRSTKLDEITAIQFALAIDDQIGNVSVPNLYIVVEQN